MNNYDSFSFLKSLGYENPEESELFTYSYYLDAIGITINPNSPWIIGGSVLRTICNEPLNTDIDLFFKNDSIYADSLKKIKNNSKFISKTKFSDSFECIFEHNNEDKIRKLQLISCSMGETIKDITLKFDIDICRVAFDGNSIIASEEIVDGILHKKMKIDVDVVTHPALTFKRIVKYARRGFEVSDENLQAFADKFFIKTPESIVNEDKY